MRDGRCFRVHSSIYSRMNRLLHLLCPYLVASSRSTDVHQSTLQLPCTRDEWGCIPVNDVINTKIGLQANAALTCENRCRSMINGVSHRVRGRRQGCCT